MTRWRRWLAGLLALPCAALALFLPGGAVTAVVAGVLVMWCTSKATMQFMRSLPHSEGKRLIVAYPCFTLYTLYALLSVY